MASCNSIQSASSYLLLDQRIRGPIKQKGKGEKVLSSVRDQKLKNSEALQKKRRNIKKAKLH